MFDIGPKNTATLLRVVTDNRRRPANVSHSNLFARGAKLNHGDELLARAVRLDVDPDGHVSHGPRPVDLGLLLNSVLWLAETGVSIFLRPRQYIHLGKLRRIKVWRERVVSGLEKGRFYYFNSSDFGVGRYIDVEALEVVKVQFATH